MPPTLIPTGLLLPSGGRRLGYLGVLIALVFSIVSGRAADANTEFFEAKIRPLLAERCYECHGEKKQKGGLRLDSAAAVRSGGDSGTALVAGRPEESRIIKAVSWSDQDLQMPPKNKLSDGEIASLTEWIKMGAPDPRTNAPSAVSGSTAAAATNHWAYQPMKK